jgi:hypothetical protein
MVHFLKIIANFRLNFLKLKMWNFSIHDCKTLAISNSLINKYLLLCQKFKHYGAFHWKIDKIVNCDKIYKLGDYFALKF